MLRSSSSATERRSATSFNGPSTCLIARVHTCSASRSTQSTSRLPNTLNTTGANTTSITGNATLNNWSSAKMRKNSLMSRRDEGRPLRIGFVFIQDANDATTWSGTPFQVLNQLRAQGNEVEVFSPLDSRIKYLLSPVKLFVRLGGRSASLDHFR